MTLCESRRKSKHRNHLKALLKMDSGRHGNTWTEQERRPEIF
jgi:hypothetical protein